MVLFFNNTFLPHLFHHYTLYLPFLYYLFYLPYVLFSTTNFEIFQSCQQETFLSMSIFHLIPQIYEYKALLYLVCIQCQPNNQLNGK